MRIHLLVVLSCCLAGAFAETICEAHRERELLSDAAIKFIPKCTPEGDYDSLQCINALSTTHYMCYTPEGRQINGPSSVIRTCGCFSHRDRLLEEKADSGFVPSCNEDGTYTKKQCNWKRGVCWCSDEEGNRISDEKTGSISC